MDFVRLSGLAKSLVIATISFLIVFLVVNYHLEKKDKSGGYREKSIFENYSFSSHLSEKLLQECLDGINESDRKCSMWFRYRESLPAWLSPTFIDIEKGILPGETVNMTWSEMGDFGLEIWTYIDNGVFSLVYVDYVNN